MWKVGTLVQPGFKPEGRTFLTTSVPKGHFTNVSSLMLFQKMFCNMVLVLKHCLVLKNITILSTGFATCTDINVQTLPLLSYTKLLKDI